MNKEVFFGEKGLTSTSANYICNIAKEWYSSKEAEISNIIGYNTYVKVLGTETYDLVTKGEFDIQVLEQTLNEISEAKALTAWLREAIKARENLVKEVKSKEIEHIPQPEKGHILTEEEYYASLSTYNRLRYYSLEAECATLGKCIHPDGKLNNLRKKLKSLPPVSLDKEDTLVLVYKYDKTIKEEDLDDVFFQLQNKYRELQAQLNKYKYECQKAIEESQIKADSEYAKAYAEWSTDVSNKLNNLRNWKNEEIKRIGDLKIIIPKSLESIYQKINNLGKEGEK